MPGKNLSGSQQCLVLSEALLGDAVTHGHNSVHSAPLVAALLLLALSLCLLLSRLSPSRDQLTLSSQMFLMISPILAFIPDHKHHLEQLTPCAPNILWFTRQLVTRATTALFSFSVLTENQHFILKEKKNNILSSHSELQHHLSCNQDIAELWCYKQTLLI